MWFINLHSLVCIYSVRPFPPSRPCFERARKWRLLHPELHQGSRSNTELSGLQTNQTLYQTQKCIKEESIFLQRLLFCLIKTSLTHRAFSSTQPTEGKLTFPLLLFNCQCLRRWVYEHSQQPSFVLWALSFLSTSTPLTSEYLSHL